ncbi:MAG: replicative DNA helicase [Spirochaetes bacterium]|nr:replicative DNA helicase [Spirochaetota bacterium]
MVVDNLPPQDLEAEASCLASVLLSKDALVRISSILDADDFYLDKHKIIYEAILELEKKSTPIDLLTLKQRLSDKQLFDTIGGDQALLELYQSVSTSANAEFYAGRIKELSLRRKIIHVCTEVIEKCYDKSKDTEELIDEVESDIFKVTERRITSDFMSIEAVMDDTMKNVRAVYETKLPVTGIATGFNDLDYLLTGLHESELIILAARPAMGKTSLALNMANHIALKERAPVLFFSLEMPATQLGMRLLCIESMVDSQKVRTGRFNSDELGKLTEVSGEFSRSPMYIDDTPNLTVMQLRTKARRMKQQIGGELGVVIIDYLQLITGSRGLDRHLQVAEITRSLKQIARELTVPVIAISQLSRAVENRTNQRPQLSDLRESGSIEQDADVVLFIYREDKVDPDTEKKGIAEVVIAKQRNGPIGSVDLLFWEQHTKFGNLDKLHVSENINSNSEGIIN